MGNLGWTHLDCSRDSRWSQSSCLVSLSVRCLSWSPRYGLHDWGLFPRCLSSFSRQSRSHGNSRVPRAAKVQAQCMSTLPVSVCILFVTILLVKACPMAKPRVSIRRKYPVTWIQGCLNSLGTITAIVYYSAISSFSFLPNFFEWSYNALNNKRLFLLTEVFPYWYSLKTPSVNSVNLTLYKAMASFSDIAMFPSRGNAWH